MNLLVTGGAGFIGSAAVRRFVAQSSVKVANVDKLTYAGNLASLSSIQDAPNYQFHQADICDAASMRWIFREFQPTAILNLAAESHVDRSIDGAAEFIRTNVQGTHTLLETAWHYWVELEDKHKAKFRFHHVSTDEVYGSLGATGSFNEESPYAPNSPYAASKAASDHLVRAWFHTYGLPTVTSNCSNNYGPYQFPEKLIPLTTINALEGRPIPVYGRGQNVRDWLYVDDHAAALELILREGRPGECYNVGGGNEVRNIDVVLAVCELLDELVPKPHSHADLIEFVADRPGHDFRYAIDASKLRQELHWCLSETFASGLRRTVSWYLANRSWWEPVRAAGHCNKRLGTLGLIEAAQ